MEVLGGFLYGKFLRIEGTTSDLGLNRATGFTEPRIAGKVISRKAGEQAIAVIRAQDGEVLDQDPWGNTEM